MAGIIGGFIIGFIAGGLVIGWTVTEIYNKRIEGMRGRRYEQTNPTPH